MLVVKKIAAPDLGAKIADAVEADSRTVQQIAVAANISDTHLYNIISRSKPKHSIEIDVLRSLEQVLGTSFKIEM